MTGKPSNTDTKDNGAPTLSVDWAYYATLLDESDASDAEKQELLETLWSIVWTFIDLGFGVHPLQQACEQNSENRINLPDDLVSLLNNQKTESGIREIEAAPSLQSPKPTGSGTKNEEAS